MGTRDEAMDDMFTRAMSITLPDTVQPWTSENYRESACSLSCLETITIPELSHRNHHCGRVLYGQFGIEPSMSWSRGWSFNDVVTLLVDTNANAMRVIMSKHLWDTAPLPERDRCFALGNRVAIKDPLMEMCRDGVFAVRLINPGQVICLDNVNEDGESREKENNANSLDELQKIRLQGNQLFAVKNWAGAVKKYSECINQTLSKLSDNNRSLQKTSKDNFSRLLMLAYSNRAESRLRLLHYEDALSDVEKALEIEPTYLKSLVRKGRAAHGLGLFEKACKAFKAALAKSPEEQSIVKDLMASTTALKQSRTGNYDLADFLISGEVPSCADFVGPVEIGRVDYGRGLRGLFATRNIKPGELILLSNPLAVFRPNVSEVHDSWVRPTDVNPRRNLVSEVLKRIRTSKRQMAQLHSLCGSGMDEMEIPSMDLFRAGSEWLPEGWEKTMADADHISEIVQFNLFAARSPCEIIIGIWALPSFANHSCSPNICCSFIGDAISFRASQNIVKGEELTIFYLSEGALVSHDVKARQAETEEMGFICKCARCLSEENFQPKLSKMIKKALRKLSNFTEAGRANDPQHEEEQLALCAKVANKVEGFILSQSSKVGPKEPGWIRATFSECYVARFRLATDEQSRLAALKLLLNSITGVGVGPTALNRAARLLHMVEESYAKHSKIYTLTFDQVLMICKGCFGEQPKYIHRKLIHEEFIRYVLTRQIFARAVGTNI